MQRFATVYSQQDFEMEEILQKLKPLKPAQVVKSLELTRSEGETGIHGIEKEFALINMRDLKPLQRLGRHSAYKFLMNYGGLPQWMRKQIMPEVFDYMVEIITEPHLSCEDAVREIIYGEAFLWTALEHMRDELPGMPEMALSQGTLFRKASITRDHIPEVWGRDKRVYLEEMIKRYGENLTPQGMHGNVSIPEPLIAYQFSRLDNSNYQGSTGYVGFKNEVYVHLASRMRAFVPLLIALEANTPFDYELLPDGTEKSIITGYNSSRWAKLPVIATTNCAEMLTSYSAFQHISKRMIEQRIIIGANNYLPIRPKGEKRLGEVPLSLERAAWFMDIVLDRISIYDEPGLAALRGHEDAPFVNRLILAEKCGWLAKRGFTVEQVIERWQKDNVQRLLGIPLNRIEIRCEEGGGDYALELAKSAFRETLVLYIFCKPAFGANWRHCEKDLKIAAVNEAQAVRYGLDCEIYHPFQNGEKVGMREFLRQNLQKLEPFARGIHTFQHLYPLYEYADGARNEAMKTVNRVMEELGEDVEKTPAGHVIVHPEILQRLLFERRKYMLDVLAPHLELDLRTVHVNGAGNVEGVEIDQESTGMM